MHRQIPRRSHPIKPFSIRSLSNFVSDVPYVSAASSCGVGYWLSDFLVTVTAVVIVVVLVIG